MENPGPHDVIQSLEVDGVGTYSVRMRVLATEPVLRETVTFTVQEKFIIGIGDSFAAGEGSPDREGSVSNANRVGWPGLRRRHRRDRGGRAADHQRSAR